jgi:hypothetical protein
MAAIIFWTAVSLICFIVNAGLAISSLIRGQPSAKALIACSLTLLCIALPLLVEPFFVRY